MVSDDYAIWYLSFNEHSEKYQTHSCFCWFIVLTNKFWQSTCTVSDYWYRVIIVIYTTSLLQGSRDMQDTYYRYHDKITRFTQSEL